MADSLDNMVRDWDRQTDELYSAREGLERCDRDAAQEAEEDERLQLHFADRLKSVVEQYTHVNELRVAARLFVDATEQIYRGGQMFIPQPIAPAWTRLYEALSKAEAEEPAVNPNAGIVQPYPKGRW